MRASLSGDSNPALGVGIVKRDDFGGVRDAVGKNVLPVVVDCFYRFQNRTLAIVLHVLSWLKSASNLFSNASGSAWVFELSGTTRNRPSLAS